MEGEELSSVPGGDMDGDASVGSAAGKQPAGAEAGDPLAGGPGRSHGGDEAQLPGAAARRAECDQEEKTKTEGEDSFAPNMVVMGAVAPAPSLGHGAYSTCAVDSEVIQLPSAPPIGLRFGIRLGCAHSCPRLMTWWLCSRMGHAAPHF